MWIDFFVSLEALLHFDTGSALDNSVMICINYHYMKIQPASAKPSPHFDVLDQPKRYFELGLLRHTQDLVTTTTQNSNASTSIGHNDDLSAKPELNLT